MHEEQHIKLRHKALLHKAVKEAVCRETHRDQELENRQGGVEQQACAARSRGRDVYLLLYCMECLVLKDGERRLVSLCVCGVL